MSLTDIMSEMKLHVYAEVALVLFLIAFILVVVHVVNGRNRDRFDKARFMPLDDDTPQEPRDAPRAAKPDSDEDPSDDSSAINAAPVRGVC